MLDRADLTAAILTVLGVVVGLVYILFVHLANFLSGPGQILFLFVTIPIYSYAAYWALSIRHALAVPLYRRQAFGIGFVVLAIWSTLGVFVLVPSSNLRLYTALTNPAFYFLFIVLFYWIDASVLAVRRADPLLRDTLYWNKIRIPFWIANIFIWTIPLLVTANAVIAGNVTLMNQLNSGNFSNSLAGRLFGIIYSLPIIVLICAIIYLPAIAIRSKWDKALRRHFLWFAPSAVCLLVLFFFGIMSTSIGHVILVPVLGIMGYSLYRSAKALVPLNRISPPEVAPKVESSPR